MTDLTDTGCQRQAHGQAMPSGRSPCPLCGRPRCWQPIRNGKRKGERCRHNPTPGLAVCVYHGVNDQARAVGAARVNAARLERTLTGGGPVEPVTDVLGYAQMLLGRLDRQVRQIELMVGDVTDSDGGALPLTPERQAMLSAMRPWLGEARRLAVALARLDIEGRLASAQERLTEAQVELVGAVEDAILAGMLARVLRALADVDGAVGVVERVWPVAVAEVVPAEWSAIEQGGE